MQFQSSREKIIVVDFGSQVTKLIARRIRDFGVFSEILTAQELYKIKNFNEIKGIILSGGPSSVIKKNFLKYQKKFFKKKFLFLGYAMDYS